MKLYLKALVAFFRRMGLPVYMADQVPGGADFPYMTLSAAYAPFTQSALVTVTAWFCEAQAHTRCVELLDALCAAIPEGGTLVHYPGGMAVLRRMAGSFASIVCDENDRRVLGGRMRLNAHLYDS